MAEFGYALSSEEHPPLDLVRNAQLAEEAGFTFALVSDHYHPWVDEQGHSPFVWAVIGGIAQSTERLRLGTGVTCPTIRIHPAIIAQAAATAAAMLPGRFFLGVGTGENLNEHVLGDKWPAPDERLEMLEEAIDVIRQLWEGGYQTYRGAFYTVEQARLYTLPDELPPIAVAASKPLAADVAAHSGDALISVAPDKDLVDGYRDAGGDGPVYGQVTCCWAETEEEGVQTMHRVWPNAGVKGDLSQELPLPLHFEQAAQNVTPEELAESLPCGPDVERYVESVQELVDAGFDHVYFHQVGRDQEGFFRFWREQLGPRLQAQPGRPRGGVAMPKGKDHGPSIKDDRLYGELREEGQSKEKAARIANAAAKEGRSAVGRRGGKSEPYEDWNVDELREKAAQVGIEGRSKMKKRELVSALRNH